MIRKHAASSWNLQDAKARLSELVDRAQAGQSQILLRRGRPAAAVVSIDEFRRLGPGETLMSFLLRSPLVGSELEIPHSDASYDFPDLFGDED